MSLLDEVVAAMDHADTASALAAVTAAFDADGALPDTLGLAETTGMDAMRALCDAFGLDVEEILGFADARGEVTALGLMRATGVPVSANTLRFYGCMVGGGITIGLRVGLMLADRKAQEA